MVVVAVAVAVAVLMLGNTVASTAIITTDRALTMAVTTSQGDM
jgi:hypothetical protein